MVGLPNRAGRCTICKRMKVKCDLTQPACSRCRRLGLRCEYLVRQQGQVFINRSVAHPFVKAVDIFSNGEKAKLSEDLYPNPATSARARHNQSLRLLIPRSPDPEPAHRMQLLSKFIEIYFPGATHGPATAGQTPASWVHVLPDITLTNPAYNASLAALCVAQLGIWNHDPVLVKESYQLYGSALGELRKTISSIGCRRLVAPEATMASIVILSTYEQFSGPSGQNSGWVHVRGGSYILQLLGPSFCRIPIGRLLFAKIRTIAMFEAFRSRRASILEGLEWERCAHEPESHDLYCHLQDLMVQLPFMMEALDPPVGSTNKIAERPVLIRLLRLCLSLNVQLLAWNERLENQGDSQLYWAVPSYAHSPADDPVLGRVFPLAFHFPSLRVAQLLLLYWSMLILLYRTIQDIQKRLQRQVTSSTETHHSFGLQDSDSREEYPDDGSCPSNVRIALLADNISQSIEYCYRAANGTHGPQLTIFPLWVAQCFYRSQADRGRELAWCSQLGSTTAPDSRFDLYCINLSREN